VLEVIPVSHAYKLVSREVKPEDSSSASAACRSAARTGGVGGPCAVESREQTLIVARGGEGGGAHLLRGGAFKPRTSPYSFQGLGEEGSRSWRRPGEETGLPVVTEAVDIEGWSSSSTTRTPSRSARATCRTSRC
jgi:3-deoxy-7-phosphoheptulonate synthase